MGSAAVLERRGCDLDSKEEIEQFVTRFYRDVAQDDVLGPYFDHTARVDWYAHHGWFRFTWQILGADGSTAAEGFDVGQQADDGRIARIVGPFGPIPASG